MSPFVISDNYWSLVSVIHIGTVVKILAFQEPAEFASGKSGFVIIFQII